MTNTTLDEAGVIEKFGVRPEQIVDLLALMGDSVDNIPGVEKCGPKTAAKWLAEYGTLDGVIANADKVGGKIGENLRDGARRSCRCRASWRRSRPTSPLERGPTDLSCATATSTTLRELYARYEFNAALKELEARRRRERRATCRPRSCRAPRSSACAASASRRRSRPIPR